MFGERVVERLRLAELLRADASCKAGDGKDYARADELIDVEESIGRQIGERSRVHLRHEQKSNHKRANRSADAENQPDERVDQTK